MDPLTLQRLLSNQVGPRIGPPEIIGRLFAAFALGLLIALAYRRAQRSLAQSHKLVGALVMLSMIVALVLMVIDTSLARAFGLVGALAIIRFRTPVKDMTDIIHMFLAVAAGISAGTGNFAVAFLGVPAVLLASELVSGVGLDRSSGPRTLLVKLVIDAVAPAPTAEPAADQGASDALAAVLERHCGAYRLLELLSVPDGPREAMYDVELAPEGSAEQLVEALGALPGVQRVVLLGAPHELDVR